MPRTIARQRRVELRFPAAGMHRRQAYPQQPPFTTPATCNVRPDDLLEHRDRGGSRPGVGKEFYEQVSGAANPIRLLTQVTALATDGAQMWTDTFSGTALSGVWSTASWVGKPPRILPSDQSPAAYDEHVGAVRAALAHFDAAAAYAISLWIGPWRGEHYGKYYIYARMNEDPAVATTDGVIAELDLSAGLGVYDGVLTAYNNTTPAPYPFTAGDDEYPASGWLVLLINGANCKVYWNGHLCVSQNVTLGANAGPRFGFGMHCAEAGKACIVDTFKIQYDDGLDSQTNRRVLVASAGGELWRDNTLGQMVKVTTDPMTDLTLASDRRLFAQERAQKLYIADHAEVRVTGTEGTISGSLHDVLKAPGEVEDWRVYGIDIHDDVAVISNGTVNVVDGTYAIASIATDGSKVTLATEVGDGTCSYRIVRGPKVYDRGSDTLSLWMADSGKGQVPTDCRLICLYRDSLVLAAPINNPHLWFMSRSGDPLDWDYSQDAADALRAVSGQTEEAGLIAAPLTALAPFSDDYLLFGCENSLWILRGHPAYGGQIDNVSRDAGVIDAAAWCWGPRGEFIFLARDGLRVLAPGGAGYPELLSKERLPEELLNINTRTHTVTLEYDREAGGVHIWVTPVEV